MTKKTFTQQLKVFMTLCLLLVGTNLAWGDSYKITFATGSGDGTNASTSTACSTVVSDGSDYLSGNLATATKVYYSGGSGLKLGTGSDAGIIKMNLSTAGQVTPTSIVVRAKRYSSSKATKLSLNSATAQDLTSVFADYTFNITNKITYLELKSTKGTGGGAYCWIESITVNYAGSSKTLESIAISGTPTKTTYEAGEEFDPAGLVVTGTYSEGDPEVITSGITWSVTPSGALTAGTTSVSVTATVDEITSEPYVVNGLTVKEFVQTYANTYTSDASLSSVITGSKVKWEGCKVTDGYAALKIAKAGTATITVPAGTKTVHLHMVAWNGESADVAVKLGETALSSIKPTADAGVSGTSTTFTIATEPKTENSYYFPIEVNADEATTLSLTTASNKRAILFGVNFEEAKKLESIAVKTDPSKTTYNVGETFNPAGLVITATYDDETTEDIAYSDGTKDDFTFSPDLNTALTAANNQVTITYGGKETPQEITVNKIATALAWSASSYEATISEQNEYPTLTTTPENLSGVTYSSSNTAVATIDDAGAISLVGVGETTITASFVGDDTYQAAPDATYTLTVKQSTDTRAFVNITSVSAEQTTIIKGGTTTLTVTNDQTGWTPSYTYTSDNGDVATVTNGTITAVGKGKATITVSVNIADEDPNYRVGDTPSKQIEITVNNPSHTARFSVDGEIDEKDNVTAEEGTTITFPADPSTTVEKYVFKGWVKYPITEPQQTAPVFVNTETETMGTADITYYAVFAEKKEGDAEYANVTTLTVGKTYIFGAVKAAASSTLANNTQFGAVAFTNTYNSSSQNWGQRVDLTPDENGKIAANNTSITDECKWLLESIDEGNYKFKKGTNYLYLGTSAGSKSGAQSGISTTGNCYIENVNSTCKDAFLLHPSSSSTNIMLYNTSNGYRMYEPRTYSNAMTPYIRFYEYDLGVTYSNYRTNVTIHVTDISVAPATTTVLAGQTKQLTVSFTPADATNKNVTWTSGNKSVATVDATGLVTTHTAGTATITATSEDGGFTSACVVTVKAITSISVKTEPRKAYLAGEKFDPTGLVITATYSDESTEDVTYAENIKDDFIFEPNLETALAMSNDKVTIGYGNNTCDLSITVKEPNVYHLVTDASQLVVGDVYIIVTKDKNLAMSTDQRPNNRGAVEIEKNDNKITEVYGLQELTLETGTKENTFAFSTGSGYLYAASSEKNYLNTEETLSDNSSWSISISDGTANIIAQGENSHKVMQFYDNSGSLIFSCYENASHDALSIYKKAKDYTVTIETPENGTLVVKNGETEVTSGNSLPTGTTLTIEPTPADGYKFKNWQYKKDIDGSKWTTKTTDFTYTIGLENVSFRANFDQKTAFTVTYNVFGKSISTESVLEEESIKNAPTPTALKDWTFEGWTADEKYTTSETKPEMFDISTPITHNLSLYAVFKKSEGEDVSEELTNEEITSLSASAALAYATEKTYSGENINYTIYGYTDNTSRPWVQLKKDKGAYFKISAPGNITRLSVTITSANNSSGGVTDITKHTAFGGEVAVLSEDCAYTAGTTPTLAATSTITNNVATLSLTDNAKDVYLKVSIGARIWGITTKYSNSTTTYTTEMPEGATISVTVNPIGNASFCSTVDLDFTDVDGVNAYIATNDDGDKLILNKRNKIPAGIGFFLIGTGGTYDVPVTSDECDDCTNNLLSGTIVPYTVKDDDNDFVWALSKKDGKLHPVNAGVKIGAGKAYLNKNIKASALSLMIASEPTGVEEIKSQSTVNGQQSTAVYNLQGMRVTTPKKGEVYIMNGKKFLMK